MATKVLPEWQCTTEEVSAIVAELRPVIDRIAARSAVQLSRWACEDAAGRLLSA